MNGNDWSVVVKLHPTGYCEIQAPHLQEIHHGDVESIEVDDSDMVVITLKWVLQMGVPGSAEFGKWKHAPEGAKKVIFPNLVVPFVIEETPEKGRRIRFGLSILYLETKSSLDPSKYR